MTNNYIDPKDGKLDFSRIPVSKKLKLLALFTTSLIMGISLLLGASHWIIDPIATHLDFNNFYINKSIHVVIMLTMVFPLILTPFSMLHLIITKTALTNAYSSWRQGFYAWKKVKTICTQTALIAPLAIFYAWSLQFVFGVVEIMIKENETYFIVPTVWFSLSLFLCVILSKVLLVRILRKIGLAV